MKVHFISLLGRGSWGGSEELWSKTALLLLSDGNFVTATVKWLTKDRRSPRLAKLEEFGIPIAFWGRVTLTPKNLLNVLKIMMAVLKGKTFQFQYDWKIPKEIDLVVINSPGNRFNPGLIEYCFKQRLPFVLICHSVSESEWITDEELDMCRTTYKKAEAVFFVSHANLESTACQLAYRGENFHVIRNPFNVSRNQGFMPAKKSGNYCMAFVGRMEPEHKGLDLLFRALNRSEWKERNYHLNLYGSGRSANQVRAMADFLGISDRLTFHGQVGSMGKVWEENAILVLPSRHEGLPLVIVEAMMCGRPCVVTDVSGNPELIEHGKTGFIAAGATINAVANALDEAWSKRDFWQEMGQVAYESVRKIIPETPVEDFASELKKIYLGTVENHE